MWTDDRLTTDTTQTDKVIPMYPTNQYGYIYISYIDVTLPPLLGKYWQEFNNHRLLGISHLIVTLFAREDHPKMISSLFGYNGLFSFK